VTEHEPTADPSSEARKNHIQILSLAQFERKVLDAHGYLELCRNQVLPPCDEKAALATLSLGKLLCEVHLRTTRFSHMSTYAWRALDRCCRIETVQHHNELPRVECLHELPRFLEPHLSRVAFERLCEAALSPVIPEIQEHGGLSTLAFHLALP